MTATPGADLIEGRYGGRQPAPDRVLPRLQSMCPELGITRIADITGLDRIGIPVVQVVRPFSLSNAVSQGKGETLAEAAISAILESTESFCGERLDRIETVAASAAALNIHQDRFANLMAANGTERWMETETAWVTAENLIDGHRTFLPLELVHTAYVDPPCPSDGIFVATTTGLAAGFSEYDAIAHGILECIERDGIARAQRHHGFFQHCRIDPATIDDPQVCELLSYLETRELLAGLWIASSPVGVPVIWCHLMERIRPDAALLSHPAEGSAAHLDPAAAIRAALYEAVQARLAAISGARDDITRASYPFYPDWSKIISHQHLLTHGRRSIDFRSVQDHREWRDEHHLVPLIEALASAGVADACAVRLDTHPFDSLSVVRVVIPPLLPLLEG